jgi:hypothetical protein
MRPGKTVTSRRAAPIWRRSSSGWEKAPRPRRPPASPRRRPRSRASRPQPGPRRTRAQPIRVDEAQRRRLRRRRERPRSQGAPRRKGFCEEARPRKKERPCEEGARAKEWRSSESETAGRQACAQGSVATSSLSRNPRLHHRTRPVVGEAPPGQACGGQRSSRRAMCAIEKRAGGSPACGHGRNEQKFGLRYCAAVPATNRRGGSAA